MDYADFYPLASDPLGIVRFLQERQLLQNRAVCVCGSEMLLKTRHSACPDGLSWRCSSATCRKWKSIRQGTWFENFRQPLGILLQITFMWINNATSSSIEVQFDLSPATVVKLTKSFRGICSSYFVVNPVRLGGPGKIVEVDQTVFGKRRKNGRGQYTKVTWAFGAIDLSTGYSFMEVMENKCETTVQSFIGQVIIPGTMIYHDDWSAYEDLHLLGYEHKCITSSNDEGRSWEIEAQDNTKITFRRIRTSDGNGHWENLKTKVKQMRGTTKEHIPGYLHEAMWRERFCPDVSAGFDAFLAHVSVLYAPSEDF